MYPLAHHQDFTFETIQQGDGSCKGHLGTYQHIRPFSAVCRGECSAGCRMHSCSASRRQHAGRSLDQIRDASPLLKFVLPLVLPP